MSESFRLAAPAAAPSLAPIIPFRRALPACPDCAGSGERLVLVACCDGYMCGCGGGSLPDVVACGCGQPSPYLVGAGELDAELWF